jgi:unsaturated rhamnogalacturonyl hydrolase
MLKNVLKMPNKALLVTSVLSAGILACSPQIPTTAKNTAQQPSSDKIVESHVGKVNVTNPSTFERLQQPVYLSFYDLGLTGTEPNLKQLAVINNADKQLINSQIIDKDFNGELDGILFLTQLAAGNSQSYSVKFSDKALSSDQKVKFTQAEISHKTGGEWVAHTKPPKHKPASVFKEYIGGKFYNVTELSPPTHYTDHSNWIRYEGPGIESDKVGYRIYLDWRNGFDIFGKLTNKPVLQQIGVDGYASYHEMQPWGMDILKVGSSLGAGGFGLWHDKSLSLVSDVQSWQANITANGDIYSSLQINYQGWQNAVNQQDLTANVSMLAGSRLAKVNLQLEQDLPALAAGVVKHKNTEFIQGNTDITGAAYTYIASWGKQALDDSYLGMAVFFKNGHLDKITQDENNYLAILEPKGNTGQQQVDYYFAAVWQPESGIEDKQAFIDYLEQSAERLTILPRVSLTTALTKQSLIKPLTPKSALAWSKKLADSELARKTLNYHYNGWDISRQRKPKFEYDIIGMQPMMYNRLAPYTGDEHYKKVMKQVTGTFVNDQGKIGRYKQSNYNIDNIAPGRNLLTLYKRTGEQKYKVAAQTLRQQLRDHPKTSEGAFWHKKKYTNQLWLDGVYMGMPFLAEYALMFEQGDEQQHSLEEVVNEFVLTRKYLRDSKTGLYYHGWDESKQQSWADKTTGLSPEFWARGMGWFAMAVVEVLDIIPADKTKLRAPLIALAKEIAADLIKVQDKDTGTWWQVMDKAGAVGNYRESSATAMFTYFFASAINNGYIGKDYTQATINAYQGMLDNFILVHANGEISITQQCYVAGLGFGRDGSYQYYITEQIWQNDPKGNTGFVLAGIEVSKLLASN